MIKSQNRSQFTPGRLLEQRYEVVKVLGSGSVGTVLHVLDRELENYSLVLKVLHPHLANDPEVVRRFSAEALLARQLTHPNIVRVYDVVSRDSLHFVAMEYIKGCTIEDLLQVSTGRNLPVEEAVVIMEQILAGLAAAHENGIVHRDIKLSNIVVDSEGTAKILDFGLAKSVENPLGLTSTGEVVGSPAYMAPEQFRNQCTAASDLYSFGILGFEILTGCPPFSADNIFSMMHMHQETQFPRDELEALGVPTWLVDILSSCTEKDADKRPKSARQILSNFYECRRSANPEGARRAIMVGVRQRQRSHHLLTEQTRRSVCIGWVIATAIVIIATLAEPSARVRIALYTSAVHRAFGLPVGPIFEALGFGRFQEFNTDSLFSAIATREQYPIIILLKSGVNPNDVNKDGISPLTFSLSYAWDKTWQLCDWGANPDAVDANGDTVLTKAVRMGLGMHVTYLLSNCKASLYAQDVHGDTALNIAISQGDFPMVTTLFENAWSHALGAQRIVNVEQKNSMHLAIERQDAKIVQELLRHGFDVNMRDGHGKTPLLRLVEQPLSGNSEEVYRILRKSGASVRARDDEGLGLADYLRLSPDSGWKVLIPASDLS